MSVYGPVYRQLKFVVHHSFYMVVIVGRDRILFRLRMFEGYVPFHTLAS